mgnify:FL=1
MTKTFLLEIYTPYGLYFSKEVEFLSVYSEEYKLGILPNHADLITTLKISSMEITFDNHKVEYAIGGGILKIENKKATLLLNSIESEDEIDLARAIEAKKRAEERLEHSENIDISRAKLALSRAINRISVKENKN